LAKREGLSISIITKSNQIVRDIDVLTKIAARSSLQIDITVTTMRPRLARFAGATGAAAGSANRRCEGIARSGAGCRCLRVALVPGITDGEGELEAVAAAAKEAGAQWFSRECYF